MKRGIVTVSVMVSSGPSFRWANALVNMQFTGFTCSLSWEISRYQGPAGFRPRVALYFPGTPVRFGGTSTLSGRKSKSMVFIADGNRTYGEPG